MTLSCAGVMAMGEEAGAEPWLAAFHAGRRETLEACYRAHFQTVDATVGRLLHGPDRESVVHDVFLRLLSSAEMRASFRGGSLAAWLVVVAKNQALEFARKQRPHDTLDESVLEREAVETRLDSQTDARRRLERFKAEVLPAKWAGVFQRCFVEQRSQREAAQLLGVSRTTLAYQELRVRSLLEKFLLQGEAP